MTDTREAIVDRLFEVVSGIIGVQTAERNRVDFDDTQLPAVSVLEGDEEVAPNDFSRVASNRPYVVTASPQVFVRVGATDVGSSLNTIRAAIIKAVHADAELTGLSLNGGGMRYAAMQTAFHVARNMIGAATLVFEIKYTLYPNRL